MMRALIMAARSTEEHVIGQTTDGFLSNAREFLGKSARNLLHTPI
jgi:hypothetical protein